MSTSFKGLKLRKRIVQKKTWCDIQAHTLTFAGYVVKETKSKVLTGPDIKDTLLSGLWIVNNPEVIMRLLALNSITVTLDLCYMVFLNTC